MSAQRVGAPVKAQPLRVLVTNFSSPWEVEAGGGQVATHDLVLALSQRGVEVHALYAGRAPAQAVFCVARVPPSSRPVVAAVRFALAARTKLALHPVDVVHSTGYEGAWLPRGKIRVAASHHPQLPHWAPPPAWRSLARAHFLWRQQLAALERQALRQSDCALFVSDWSRRHASKSGYPFRESRVVWNGVDIDRFHPAPSVSDRADTVLFCGRMDDQKGVDILLRAFSGIETCARLVLVGTGWRERAYRELASRLGIEGRTRFLGAVAHDRLPGLMQSAGVVVLPSRYENLPLAILEAMASGVAVVATRVGGVPELVSDGTEGLLVEPEDVPGLEKAIRRLLKETDLAAEMGRAGRRRVTTHFTWAAVAERVASLYADLVGR